MAEETLVDIDCHARSVTEYLQKAVRSHTLLQVLKVTLIHIMGLLYQNRLAIMTQEAIITSTSLGSSSSPYCIVKSIWLTTVSNESVSVKSSGRNDTSGWSSIYIQFRNYGKAERAPDSLAVQLLDLEHEIGDWICSPPFPSLLLEVGDLDPDSWMWWCQKQTLPKYILKSGKCSGEA